jgi:hypothetical protein
MANQLAAFVGIKRARVARRDDPKLELRRCVAFVLVDGHAG